MLFIKKEVAERVKSMGREEKSAKLQQEIEALLHSKPQEDYPVTYMFLANMLHQQDSERVAIMTMGGNAKVPEKK